MSNTLLERARQSKPRRSVRPSSRLDEHPRDQLVDLASAFLRKQITGSDIARVMGFRIQNSPHFVCSFLRREIEEGRLELHWKE